MEPQETNTLVPPSTSFHGQKVHRGLRSRYVIGSAGVILIVVGLALACLNLASEDATTSKVFVENAESTVASDDQTCGANDANDDMYVSREAMINPRFCTGSGNYTFAVRMASLIQSNLALGGVDSKKLPSIDALRDKWCNGLGTTDDDASGYCSNAQRSILVGALTQFAIATNYNSDCSNGTLEAIRPYFSFDASRCFAAALRVLPAHVASFATNYSLCLFAQHTSTVQYENSCPACFVNDNIRFATRARYNPDCGDPLIKAVLPQMDYGSFPLAVCVAHAQSQLQETNPYVAAFMGSFYGCQFSNSFLGNDQH